MRARALLILALVATAAGPVHAEPLRARVVDVQTGRPVEGAVVSGRWVTRAGASSESEVETDAQGWFTLDRPAEPLRERDGEIVIVYKFGYVVWLNNLLVHVEGSPRVGQRPRPEEPKDPRVPGTIMLAPFPRHGHRPYHLSMLFLILDADGHKERRPRLLRALAPEQAAAEKQVEELCRNKTDCD
jgi:hypothetical protein